MKRIKYSIIFCLILALGYTSRVFVENSKYNRFMYLRIRQGNPKEPRTEPELTNYRLKLYDELNEPFGFQQDVSK